MAQTEFKVFLNGHLRWSVLIGLRGSKIGEVPILLPLSPECWDSSIFMLINSSGTQFKRYLNHGHSVLMNRLIHWWIQNWSLLWGDWTIKDEAWLVACFLGLLSLPICYGCQGFCPSRPPKHDEQKPWQQSTQTNIYSFELVCGMFCFCYTKI